MGGWVFNGLSWNNETKNIIQTHTHTKETSFLPFVRMNSWGSLPITMFKAFFHDIFRKDYVQNGRIFCVLCCWKGKTLFNEALNLLHKYVKEAIDKMENKFKYSFCNGICMQGWVGQLIMMFLPPYIYNTC